MLRARTIVVFVSLIVVLALSAGCPSVAQAGYMDVVLADNPVGYWRLGETTGSALDSSTNSNVGAYTGGVTRGQVGPQPTSSPVAFPGFESDNAATLFNGLTGYVSIADPADGALDMMTQDWTIEAWVYIPSSNTSWGCIVGKRWTTNSRNGYDLNSSYNADTGEYEVTGYFRGSAVLNTPGGVVTPDAWHHVAVVLDRDVGASLYVDGGYVGTTASTMLNGVNIDNDQILAIGRYGCSNSAYFQGRVDEVAVYNQALDGDDIGAHYAAAIPEPSTLVLLAMAGLALLVWRRWRK